VPDAVKLEITMRRILLASAFLVLAAASMRAGELSQMDRERLIAHLDMTGSWLVDEVSGLSKAQLDFRRAPGTWSILEVFDHLVVVGPIYWDDLQRALKGPVSSRDVSGQDANILWYGIDRTNREQAIPSEVPSGKLRDLQTGLGAYRKQHARLVDYVKTTKDDLRAHIVERQRCDGYQWALLISTHEQRHILQIREIKADPKFPKK
jgi:DinB superfamily